ncbi:MAG: shikimate dehydrogenase [Thermosynechococcaceae cyanobacterium]
MTHITGNTKLLGVIGCPIHHSLSPVMHNAALAYRASCLGLASLDYIYVPLKIEPTDLGVALAGMAAMGWQGFNVTIPHKQAIMPFLSEISPLAQAVGAVNTVWRRAGIWCGTNTDVHGFLAPLRVLDRSWKSVNVCILGGGGAARAVIAACTQLGCAAIHVVGRDWTKLMALQDSLSHMDLPIAIQIHSWTDLPHLLPQMGLVVNTTPIGMHPQVEDSPLSAAAIAQLPPQALVYDLIYTPRPTKLLTLAQEQGYRVLDGLDMLVQQGAAAFEQWVGEKPSVAVMRQAALECLP